jgi:hypothetical protein
MQQASKFLLDKDPAETVICIKTHHPKSVASQQHVSPVYKDVLITTEENLFYLLQLSLFLELRYVSLRCNACQKIFLGFKKC